MDAIADVIEARHLDQLKQVHMDCCAVIDEPK
jgi:hypothetical protein